ncbi:MAG: hypothetical protein LBD16_01380, partial [Oscillospiraceae bacterium]|nr:hypothetical protein [Oscillospiraceae bacterium]
MPKNKNRSRYVIMEEETEAPRKKKSSQPRNTYQAGAMPQMPQGMQRMMPPGVPQGMPQMQQGMQRGMMPQGMPQGAQRGMLNHPAKTAEPPRQNCGFVGGPGVLSGTPGMPSPAGFPSP